MDKRPKILIVEDDETLNDAYKTALTLSEYIVKSAPNGKEALSIIAKWLPDLIFLDLKMPVLDGIGFLRKFRLMDNYPAIKVVVFSNYDNQREVEEAYELGANRYILKSWLSPRELVKIIEDTTGVK